MTVDTPAPPAPPAPPAAVAAVPPPGAPGPADAPAARPGARVIAIVMIVVGALIVVSTLGWAAVSTAGTLSVRTSERTVSAAGVTGLRLDVSASGLRVEFVRVATVELQVTGPAGADRWTMDVDSGDLVVASGDHDGSRLLDRSDEAVLRLPLELKGLDAALTVSAGRLIVEDGAFGDLAIVLGAGTAEVDATAESVDLQLEAGEADVSIAGVDTAAFTVSAGDLTADLGGGQPASVRLDVSAGDVDVTLAPGEYLLTGDMTDSDLVDTDLVSSPAATSTIDARVSFGDVTVSSAR